jgi:NB-ARC domain
MVLDNVENVKLVRAFWSVCSHGPILVTSRHDIVSYDLATAGMEVHIFSEEEGSSLLLKHVGRPSYSAEELEAARQLSEQVNGLPLALITLGSQVTLRRKTFRDFLTYYDKYRRQLHKEKGGIETYYDKSLDTCWQTAFGFLSSEASYVLGVLSFIAPDAIPEQLFRPNDFTKLPGPLKVCEDAWKYVSPIVDVSSITKICFAGSTKLCGSSSALL